MQPVIPFTRPFISGNENRYLSQAIDSGSLAADGYFTQRCTSLISDKFGVGKIVMTPSCTAALEMAILLCDLGPGDEVILPSFTFASTANAVIAAHAKPIFVDIRPDTLNLNEELIEQAITPNTKAIMPVHYGGIACEMGKIMDIAQRHQLRVIEDAAQAVNASYDGRWLGSIGHLGAFSFHHTKNYVCGEGGALCINESDLTSRADIIREKGTNRIQFLRGDVDKYTWVNRGSSYVLSEINCAFLYAQLEQLDWITERRREIFERYLYHFTSIEEEGFIQLPTIPESCRSNYHIFYLILRDVTARDGLMRFLKERGIEAAFHYVPLHSSPMGRALGYHFDDLPITQNLSSRLLRLPIYPQLTEREQLRIIDEVKSFFQYTGTDVLVRDLTVA